MSPALLRSAHYDEETGSSGPRRPNRLGGEGNVPVIYTGGVGLFGGIALALAD